MELLNAMVEGVSCRVLRLLCTAACGRMMFGLMLLLLLLFALPGPRLPYAPARLWLCV